jgi:lipoprotein-anchoring transpeptidase ErfK/SrfK
MGVRTIALVGAAIGIVGATSGWILPGLASGSGGDPAEASDTTELPAEEWVVLPGPSLEDWTPASAKRQMAAPAAVDTGDYPLFAQARYHNAPVYSSLSLRWGRGMVRYGQIVRARWLGTSEGCDGGRWFELARGGYVCTTRGFRVRESSPAVPQDATPPVLKAPLPFRYARVVHNDALRLKHPMTADEIAALPTDFDAEHPPDGVVGRMEGDYFLALADPEQAADGTEYYRTVRGHYARVEDLKHVDPPQMRGAPLTDLRLPLAFVYGADEAPVYRITGAGRGRVRAGTAKKHARTEVLGEVELEGARHWQTRGGLALPSEHVRVARAIERPGDVEADERWVHVDLSEQTLVAYEGDTPVYATLISSGKEGYDTAPGFFRVRHKYVSITMSGDDEKEGYYEVEEVPWTHYYDANFALHGAYWHDDFGKVRSHGCTNIAPADARWLYEFTSPHVPTRWHGVRDDGTAILITP